ncbi:MAG: Gfo/Idh/MocA family oxidoreductase [Sphaerochaetaceae bacterium]|nr:Gfo/Idh/MocA family oxidoreductase [Sphaerochaetaceae bacterium]
MDRMRFIIVGSGWRSLYFVRIVKALPERFELCAMLCRTQEKAAKMAAEYGIHTTTSIDECVSLNPDFVVVVVTKTMGHEVAMQWMDLGFCVLLETPAGLDLQALNETWKRHEKGQKIVICEQYNQYPQLHALIQVANSGLLGNRHCLNISIAHEYHGASIMRELLDVPTNEQFTLTAKTYEFPTTQTLTRYDDFKDGRIANKKRTIATFEFENGKVAVYDFDSEQYRSPIRKNTVKLQGTRGEIIDEKVYYLDAKNDGVVSEITISDRLVETPYDNPNLKLVREVMDVSFEGKSVYSPVFGPCGLAQDETAIATIMQGTYRYAKGQAGSPYPLEKALQDAYIMILMQKADQSGEKVKSERQIWN